MLLIQILLIAVMAIALYVTWKRVTQHVITRAEAIGWSLLWVLAAIVVALPNTATRIAEFVGVGRGVDLVLYASVAGLFLLVFKLFVQHQKLERKLTDLVRIEALRNLEDDQCCGSGACCSDEKNGQQEECCGGACHESCNTHHASTGSE